MTKTTKNAPRLRQQPRRTTIIHTSKGRNNMKPSRKQRLLDFQSRAVDAKIRARTPNDIPSVRIDGEGHRAPFGYQKASRQAGGGGPRHEPEPFEVHDLCELVPEMSAKDTRVARGH